MAGSRNHEGQTTLIRAALRTVLVAPDSFKGSLSAPDAAHAMALGVKDALPDVHVICHPVSDGGEGLADLLTAALGGELLESDVRGPLPGQRVTARWGYVATRRLAILEMAQAAGLTLVPENMRDPGRTTTVGVGELLRAALDRRATEVVIGIGGSATNDGGAGMAQALGARLLDSAGISLPAGGEALARLSTIDVSAFDERIRRTKITVACDVVNPLLGPDGATFVYGPQKGATQELLQRLETALRRYAEVLERSVGKKVDDVPGSGAAGGLGAGLLAFCDATLMPGIDLVLDTTGFDENLATVDLVLSGEGRLDLQTRFGKALAGVLRRVRSAGKPLAVVAGTVEGNVREYTGPGKFVALATLTDSLTPVDTAIRDASRLLRERTAGLIGTLVADA